MASSPPSPDTELAFLIEAIAPDVREPAAHPIDWPRLIRLARKHRVLPRLWARRGHLCPPEYAPQMRALVAENGIAALRNIARTLEVVNLLHAAGVDSIILKGPLLAHDLYGDVALRVAGDIDLLVHEDQLLMAARVLDRAGYRHDTQLTEKALARHRKSQHDLAFVHKDDDTLIELHAEIAQPHYGFRLDLSRWWQARRPRRIGSDTVWVLGPEHAYLLTALHAAKHRWHRLDLVSDVAMHLEHGIDLDSVHSEAASAWLLRHVLTGEALAAWMFAGKPSDSPVVQKAVSQLVAGKDFDRWSGIAFDLRLRERKADQAAYLWKRLLSSMLRL